MSYTLFPAVQLAASCGCLGCSNRISFLVVPQSALYPLNEAVYRLLTPTPLNALTNTQQTHNPNWLFAKSQKLIANSGCFIRALPHQIHFGTKSRYIHRSGYIFSIVIRQRLPLRSVIDPFGKTGGGYILFFSVCIHDDDNSF